MAAFLNMEGQKFNRLTVIEKANVPGVKTKWRCKCDCGNELLVIAGHLRNGNTKSCGCHRSESSRQNGINNRTHGMTKCPEYKAWQNLKDRCCNPDAEQYPHYGGRGIEVCNEWMISFEAFYRDMGARPGKAYSIDRIDVNGNYIKSNCRWATAEEQSNNKRLNVKYLVEGEELSIAQIARKYSIPQATLYSRLFRDSLPIEEAISKKVSRLSANYKGVTKSLLQWADELGISYYKLTKFVTTVSPNLEGLVGGLEN